MPFCSTTQKTWLSFILNWRAAIHNWLAAINLPAERRVERRCLKELKFQSIRIAGFVLRPVSCLDGIDCLYLKSVPVIVGFGVFLPQFYVPFSRVSTIVCGVFACVKVSVSPVI